MRWWIRGVTIAENFTGTTFSITGEDGVECVEGLDSFNYLGWILHRADEDWPTVIHDIRRARQFWGRLGKLLRREGADPIISEKFYRTVVQAVLLFGSETWVLTAAMMQNIKDLHVGFLWQVAGKKARRIGDETWRKEGADSVLQAAGTKPLMEYTKKRQAVVIEWVALRPIFEVCVKETGYIGGGSF